MFQSLKSKLEYASGRESQESFNFKDNLLDWIGSIKNILTFIICMLISACEMSSGATPFALAIFAAVGSIQVPLVVPFFLITLVSGISFGWMAALKFSVSAILYVAIKSFIKTNDSRMSNASIVMFACMMAEIMALAMNGLLLYDALFSVYTCILTGVFYIIFSEGLPTIYNIAKPKIYASESLIACGVVLALVVSSLGDFGVFGITFRGVISILIVMILGWKRGASIGATAGLTIALILGLMGYGDVSTVATYAFCGMLTGVLAKFGKIGAVIGFILGNIILVFFANGSTEVIISIKEIVIASVALFVLPKKVFLIIDDLFDYNKSLPGEQNLGYIEENTVYKLGAVSDVVSGMADNVVSAPRIETQADQIGSFIKTLNENTCRRCKNYENCWKNNYHKMYEETFEAIEVLQIRGEITEKDLETSICSQKTLLAEGLNLSYEIYKVNKEWQEKVKEQRLQMALQLKEISHEIDRVKNEIHSSLIITDTKETENNYTLEFGIARTKKHNSVISGDSNTIIKLKDGKLLVAISDGMGSGEIAARNSKKVLLNLEKLLNTGLEEERAIKLINSYLLVGKDPENFATIDALIFDPESGIGEFIKIGSCPTFIKGKEGKVLQIDSVTLPVGIANDIEIETKTKLLKVGDTVVMVTDGIIDADIENNENSIRNLLKSIKTVSAQRLADIILQEAIDSNLGIARDDMTVIIARVV